MAGLQRVAGSVALVTGAASGIGEATARALVAGGASVVLADLDEDGAQALARELGEATRAVRCDVAVRADTAAAVELAVSELGGLDLAFLNAGVATGDDWPAELDLDRYDRVRAVNTDSVVYGTAAALPALRARGGGAVVATASLAGLTPVPADPVYALSKAAVVAWCRSVGPALAAEGITVNAVCPGFARTRIIAPLEEGFRAADFPLLTAEQVAAVVLAAATGGETGQAYVVQPGRDPGPYAFRGVPSARHADGRAVPLDGGGFTPRAASA